MIPQTFPGSAASGFGEQPGFGDSGFLPSEPGTGGYLSSSSATSDEFMVACPTCQMQYKVRSEHFGTEFNCQNCKQTFEIAGENPHAVEMPFDSLEPERSEENATESTESQVVEVEMHESDADKAGVVEAEIVEVSPVSDSESAFVKLHCPDCDKRYKLPAAKVQDPKKRVTCRKCGSRFRIAEGMNRREGESYVVTEIDLSEEN